MILLSVAVLGALGAPTVPKYDELVPEVTPMREIDTNMRRPRRAFTPTNAGKGWRVPFAEEKSGIRGVPFVTRGVAFTPEVMYAGQWFPICGHYFWDNNNGANIVCKSLGFSGGTVQQTRSAYKKSAMPVGSCSAGQKLSSCTGGGNAWGKFDFHDGMCLAGTAVGITVTCTDSSYQGHVLQN